METISEKERVREMKKKLIVGGRRGKKRGRGVREYEKV